MSDGPGPAFPGKNAFARVRLAKAHDRDRYDGRDAFTAVQLLDVAAVGPRMRGNR